MICMPNECYWPNCDCPKPPTAEPPYSKPTYEQQLAWLDSHGDSEIIRAIKENVIVVRLMHRLK